MLDTSFLLWLQQWASPAFTEIVRAVSLWGLWLPRTSYVLHRLRLWAFSDSLQSCHPSLFRCSTRSDLSSQSRLSLHLEIIALRHQLAVINRSRRPRLRLTLVDRLLWA